MQTIQSLAKDFLDRHGDRIIVTCSALMFAFVVNFLSIMLQASAALAATGCGGDNLMDRYRIEAPATYEAILAEASKTENGKGVFWKIEKSGAAPSWLLGTMHVADARVAKLDGKRLEAFQASDTVVVENVEALDQAQATAAMLAHKDMALYTDGTTLEDRLDQETIEELRTAAENRGMPFAMVKIMRPWMVAASIALPPCEMEAKQQGKPVLDALLVEKAKASGKNLVGLETIAEQFGAMSAAPESFHLKMLKETVEMGSVSEDVMATMKQLYLDGEIAMITPLTRSVSPEIYESDEFSHLSDSLIDRRNIHMAERAASYIDEGNAFIAVGALHLPGEKGLVSLLRKAGYTVTPAN